MVAASCPLRDSQETRRCWRRNGAVVSYCDPYVPALPRMRESDLRLKSVEIGATLLAGIDCVIIAADHDAFDYSFIQKRAKLIVDTRGRYRGSFENVVKC